MTDRDEISRDHNGTWTRIWSCLSQPFRKRRRSLPEHVRRQGEASGSRREREPHWRELPRWDVGRRESLRDPRTRRANVEARNEVRKRYRAPSPETFDKLRQAIIQAEEATNEKKTDSKYTIPEENEIQDISVIGDEVAEVHAEQEA